MRRRIETRVIRSGQPRPYADHHRVVEITFTSQGVEGYSNPDAPFKPDPYYCSALNSDAREHVVKALPGLCIGYLPFDKKYEWHQEHPTALYENASGVWIFEAKQVFLD